MAPPPKIAAGRQAARPTPTEALLLIAAAPDRIAMLQVLTEQARAIIGAHQSVTSLTISDSWSQAITAVSLSDKYASWRVYDELPDGSGIYNVVCQTNRSMRMTQEELERHRAWRGFGAAVDRHPPMRGWLAVPLISGNGTNLGLVQLSDKYEGEFTAEDETVLSQLARLASIAIERANAESALRAALDESRRKEEELHRLAQELVAARENERKRLSFDLHDNVCQDLVGIDILVGAVAQRLDADESAPLAELARIGQYLRSLMEHLRTMAGELQPMHLQDLGLERSLRAMATGITGPASIEVVLSPSVPRLASETELALYRVAQEGMLNAQRHARAGSIVVALALVGEHVRLEIRDDGRGFDPERLPLHALGIASMRERALALGGGLELSSRCGEGTTIRFTCPVTSPARRPVSG